MKDALEKYIVEHKEEFNQNKLDEHDKLKLWSQISNALPDQTKKTIPLWKSPMFRVAASIIVFVGCAFTFFMINQSSPNQQVVNQELYDIDNHYKLIVNNQIELIKNNPNFSNGDKEDFLSLIDDLDKEYNNLKQELKEDINNQKIIEAIINNYRKKIELMQNLLQRKHSIKNNNDHGELIL